MTNENKKEEGGKQITYGVPSNTDINRFLLSLIHDGEISENYVPDYEMIVSKYMRLAELKNIKIVHTDNSDQNYPCNEDILEEVIHSIDRFT
jgi:Fe-S-cluster formation regulator IscX/YfhJ